MACPPPSTLQDVDASKAYVVGLTTNAPTWAGALRTPAPPCAHPEGNTTSPWLYLQAAHRPCPLSASPRQPWPPTPLTPFSPRPRRAVRIGPQQTIASKGESGYNIRVGKGLERLWLTSRSRKDGPDKGGETTHGQEGCPFEG